MHRSPFRLRCRSVPSPSRDSLVARAGRGDRADTGRDDGRPTARVAQPVGLDGCRRPGRVGRVPREWRRAVRHDGRPRRRRFLVYVSEPSTTVQARARPADAVGEGPDRRQVAPPSVDAWISRRIRTQEVVRGEAADTVRADSADPSTRRRSAPADPRRRATAASDEVSSHLMSRTAIEDATSGSSGCTQGSPNSIDGSTTACAPGSPTRRSPATEPGTNSRPDSSMRGPAASPTGSGGSPGSSVPRRTGMARCSPNSACCTCCRRPPGGSDRCRIRSPMPWPPPSAGRCVRPTCSAACPTPTSGSSPAAATPARIASRCAGTGCVGANSGRWALVLSFAAYRQSLDTSLEVGTSVHADLHRYPGPALRALVGVRHAEPVDRAIPPAVDVAGACDEIGSILVGEPWLDRVPVTVRAAVSRAGSGWVLTDDTGSLPLLPGRSIATLLAVSGGGPGRRDRRVDAARRRAADDPSPRPFDRHRPPCRRLLRERRMTPTPTPPRFALQFRWAVPTELSRKPSGEVGEMTMADHWRELVTTAMLGTDRRDPPPADRTARRCGGRRPAPCAVGADAGSGGGVHRDSARRRAPGPAGRPAPGARRR